MYSVSRRSLTSTAWRVVSADPVATCRPVIVTGSDQACSALSIQWVSIQATPEHKHTQYTNSLHYTPLVGIGSGHRQLITVTCIAEHA